MKSIFKSRSTCQWCKYRKKLASASKNHKKDKELKGKKDSVESKFAQWDNPCDQDRESKTLEKRSHKPRSRQGSIPKSKSKQKKRTKSKKKSRKRETSKDNENTKCGTRKVSTPINVPEYSRSRSRSGSKCLCKLHTNCNNKSTMTRGCPNCNCASMLSSVKCSATTSNDSTDSRRSWLSKRLSNIFW